MSTLSLCYFRNSITTDFLGFSDPWRCPPHYCLVLMRPRVSLMLCPAVAILHHCHYILLFLLCFVFCCFLCIVFLCFCYYLLLAFVSLHLCCINHVKVDIFLTSFNVVWLLFGSSDPASFGAYFIVVLLWEPRKDWGTS